MLPWVAAAIAGLFLGLTPLGGPLHGPGVLLGTGLLALAVKGHTRADLARGALVGALWFGTSLSWFLTTWTTFDSVGTPVLAFVGLVALQLVVPATSLGLAGALRARGVGLPLALGLALPAADGLVAWVQPLPGSLALYLAPTQPLLWPAALGGTALLLGVAGAWAGLQATRPAVGVCVLAGWLGLGLLPAPWVTDGTPLPVGLIQPNDGAFDARRGSSAEARADRIVRLVDAAATAGATLVVTPEASWPQDPGPAGSGRRQALAEAFRPFPAVLLGASVHDGRLPTNSLLALEHGQVVGRVDKHHLVPLGERAVLGFGRDTYRPGSPAPVTLASVPLAARICYEDLVPTALAGLGDAEVLVAASNDTWLGHGRQAHEAGTRLAAVLTGRWVVRPTSAGPSAVYDPSGRRTWRAPFVDGDAAPDHPGFSAVQDVRRRRPMWTGADVGPWLALLAGLAAAALAIRGPARPGLRAPDPSGDRTGS